MRAAVILLLSLTAAGLPLPVATPGAETGPPAAGARVSSAARRSGEESDSTASRAERSSAGLEESQDRAVEVFRFTFEGDEDRDFDRRPDGWIRRKGPAFPGYVEAAIDPETGHAGKGASLRFRANGGRVILYSKPIPIDPYHSYFFRGYLRTQSLENDAALVSVSLLNHKRQRIQRFLTRPVTGTFKDWCEVTIGPIVPQDDVHFVVVGCHLVHGSKMDIRGSAWFDDLWMGELPLYSLEANFQAHFREHDSPIVITSHVDGLDPKRTYSLDMQMVDANGKLVASRSFALDSRRPPPAPDETHPSQDASPAGLKKSEPIRWTLPPKPHGFYAVESVLNRDGQPILVKKTSFAVMDSLNDVAESGEFGWTIRRPEDITVLSEVAEIASQAGINWLKYPLWRSVYEGHSATPAQITSFFEELSQRRITPVGLLNDPPPELRSQFARDWTGISEVFTMRTEFWRESIEKVIARYSSHVRHWQLGEESDASFVGMSSQTLAETLARVKSEFDRIGRDTRIGVHWDWDTPLPRRGEVRGTFLSLGSQKPLAESELVERIRRTGSDAPERWVLVKGLPKSGFSPEQRGSDLVKQMVEAKIGGADRIFIDDVFNEETGILNPGGAPSLLFLPWRTTAMALAGADFIGSFPLPEGSRNYAFARNGEVAIVVWNNEAVDEDLYLGDESIVTDVLGRRIPLPSSSNRSGWKLRVGRSPLVIRRFPEPVARWMTAVTFDKGRLASKVGKQRETIRGLNTFKQGVSGELRIIVPKDWKVDPPEIRFSLAAGERFAWPITLELPSNTSLGSQRIVLEFATASAPFRVYRDYKVGLGDVVLSVVDSRTDNGDLQIKQLIDNNTQPEETLNFECNLYVPNRKRMQKSVIKLGHGRDSQFYLLPDADSLRGRELHLRAQQIGGQRVLNLRWKVGENWDKSPGAAAKSASPVEAPAASLPADRSAAESPRTRRGSDAAESSS
jgi:hypothetical protein